MTASARDRRRDLVDLLPQFLTRRMRGWAGLLPLLSERGLTRQDAYVLCSLAADLKITEVVDAPNWIVACFMPDAVFAGD